MFFTQRYSVECETTNVLNTYYVVSGRENVSLRNKNHTRLSTSVDYIGNQIHGFAELWVNAEVNLPLLLLPPALTTLCAEIVNDEVPVILAVEVVVLLPLPLPLLLPLLLSTGHLLFWTTQATAAVAKARI